MKRRQIFSMAALAGFAGAEMPHEPALEQTSERSVEEVARAVDRLTAEIHGRRVFPELDAVREAQKTFLRTTGKFPDFIDVGMNVWYALYDWHVRWQQPITIGRDASGRYTLSVTQTTIVMRPEQAPGFIGPPYDIK
jgi:hypothetical protein